MSLNKIKETCILGGFCHLSDWPVIRKLLGFRQLTSCIFQTSHTHFAHTTGTVGDVQYVLNPVGVYHLALTLNIPRGVLRRIYAFYWLTSVETNKHIIFYANNA
jgi:hypothetical protein